MNAELVRREALVSAGINALISATFFLVIFGLSRPAELDAFASDFLVQSFMVGLAAAFVPPLIVRQRLGLPEGVRTVLLRAIGFAVASMVVAGGAAFLICHATNPGSLDPRIALFGKIVFEARLGATVTVAALRRLRGVQEVLS